VVRTQCGINPVFVSLGYLVDLSAAQQIVFACALRYWLPEPTRLPDQLVGEAKRAMGDSSREGILLHRAGDRPGSQSRL
jgi:hypothetical protein